MSDTGGVSRAERWSALMRYDPEIAAYADKLAAYGPQWLEEFGRAFFALDEDRAYLPMIGGRLLAEAAAELEGRKQEIINAWKRQLLRTNMGELTSEASLAILEKAMDSGFSVMPSADHTIIVEKEGLGVSYLHSNAEIARFAKIHKFSVDE